MLKFFLVLPLIFASPQVKVNWTDSKFESLHIRVDFKDELMGKCLRGGLEMEYAFDARLCRRRTVWFDACAELYRERHHLSFEPISSNYTLVSDRLDDDIGPQTRNFKSLEEAQAAMAEMEEVTLAELAGSESQYLNNSRVYLSARAQSRCKGSYNRTLAGISSFLTLGLVRISGFDTGWVDFTLAREEES
ncbi:MAG: DUF4390 domain-containing protein [Deltaproteobacteria bacterium]|nr:DUF4390 domain-containing protein [Deltaproteobacteria bacterium]